ncbi:MAG: monovalent cation/H(+) antiporter subunit G [Polyangiaceae bacterium]
MRDGITVVLMALGVLLTFIGALGVVRLPDVYMRLSASAKASTLGVGSLLGAAAVHFGELSLASRAAAVIVLILSTAPVAAHMIGRAAYFSGVPLWRKTVCDELRDAQEGGGEGQSGEGGA